MLALSAGWEVAGVVAACLAALFGAWAVWLQLDSRRALLTITFTGRQEFFRAARRFVDYLLHVSNDGHVSVREVKATGFIDGTELETIAPDPAVRRTSAPE
jgi:hypothetical protein